MMRTTIGQRLAGLACCAALFAYSGWAFTATFGNPATSGEIARSMLSRPAITDSMLRSAAPLTSRLRLEGVDATTATKVAQATLADQRVVDSVADAVGGVHRDLVEGSPTVRLEVPGSVLTAAARDAAAAHGIDPGVVRDVPSTSIAVPSTQALGSANRFAERWGLALRVAVGALALALVVSDVRALVLRRVARWMVASSAFALVGSLVAAWTTRSSGSPFLAGAGSVAGVWRARTQPVLIAVLCIGVALWAMSGAVLDGRGPAVLDRFTRRRPLGEPTTARVPRIDARGRPVPGVPQGPAGDRDETLPEYNPWLDGNVRGGRYSTTTSS